MKKENYNFSNSKLKLRIWIYRFCLIVGLTLILLILIRFLSEILNSKNTESLLGDIKNVDGLRVFIFGTASAITIYGLKGLVFDKIDGLIEYIFLRDIEEESVLIENLSPDDNEPKKTLLRAYVAKNIKWKIPISVFVYFIVISGTGLIAYQTWDTEKKSNNLYAFNLSDDELLVDNLGQFKLIFSFGHNDSILAPEDSADELKTLKYLMRSFRGCLQDPKEEVVLKIRGFASENHNHTSAKSSDIILANNRAKNVKRNIEDLIDELKTELPHVVQIKSEIKEWKFEDYDKMIRARIFREVNIEQMTTDYERQNESAEYLNRRVEISIAKAGACE